AFLPPSTTFDLEAKSTTAASGASLATTTQRVPPSQVPTGTFTYGVSIVSVGIGKSAVGYSMGLELPHATKTKKAHRRTDETTARCACACASLRLCGAFMESPPCSARSPSIRASRFRD